MDQQAIQGAVMLAVACVRLLKCDRLQIWASEKASVLQGVLAAGAWQAVPMRLQGLPGRSGDPTSALFTSGFVMHCRQRKQPRRLAMAGLYEFELRAVLALWPAWHKQSLTW